MTKLSNFKMNNTLNMMINFSNIILT